MATQPRKRKSLTVGERRLAARVADYDKNLASKLPAGSFHRPGSHAKKG